MPASRPLVPAARVALRFARRTGSVLRESFLLVGFVALLEVAGPRARNDAIDFLFLVGAVLLGMLLTRAAQAGWMPGTAAAGRAIGRRATELAKRLSPRYAVGFRPTEAARTLPDRTLLAPILAVSLAAVGLLALGPRLFGSAAEPGVLLFLKTSVSYTAYLAVMAVVWGLFLVTAIMGTRVAAQGLAERSRDPSGPSVRGAALALGAVWFAGLAAVLLLPGIVPLLVLLLIGWWRGRVLAAVPPREYLFCRRDEAGRARAVPVRQYLRRVHGGMLALLALVVVLGQSTRLWPDFTPAASPLLGRGPGAPFAFTAWGGILATLCAVLLVARAGAHFQRLLGGQGVPPEVPLTPTLWMRSPEGAEGADDEWARGEAWYRLARENGWLVLRQGTPPPHEYDLVMGLGRNPRGFTPRPPPDEADARFQLERRLHVVMRRRFHRHFQSFFKRLKAVTPSRGTGYLFCPHIWLVPGVVRDLEQGEPSDDPEHTQGSGALGQTAFYGPPYAHAFPERVRRYVGGILRDLQVDIIFWEDAITWSDLRRVLTVAYEIHDQRRSPLLERHFVGVPRVRVVIQEEAAEPDAARPWPAGGKPAGEGEAPAHARLMLIMRDRGHRADSPSLAPADTWIRSPTLV